MSKKTCFSPEYIEFANRVISEIFINEYEPFYLALYASLDVRDLRMVKDVLSSQGTCCFSAKDVVEAFEEGESEVLLKKAKRSLKIKDFLKELEEYSDKKQEGGSQ